MLCFSFQRLATTIKSIVYIICGAQKIIFSSKFKFDQKNKMIILALDKVDKVGTGQNLSGFYLHVPLEKIPPHFLSEGKEVR